MKRTLFLITALLLLTEFCFATAHVDLKSDSLWIDGQKQPFLYGAEVQYFRARAGSRRNVPVEKVDALWNKLLDRVQEAGMNSVIFYIPWDFHEPLEGVFDFDGSLDRDQDGKPDYPSRNIKKFLKMVSDRGFKNTMVRPGPYINAEWGHEGFGAIPTWFLDNYPQALTVNQHANRARTVAFSHPDFQLRAERWFKALHQQVLKNYIGAGKTIAFLQIDNESNFFWDSVYERDRSERSVFQFQEFIKSIYHGNISELNQAYGSHLTNFTEVKIPNDKNDIHYPNGAWHYDWSHFHDFGILEYYRFLRTTWEKLGVNEPDVLFTSCDSFNASGEGLLPRLDYRGQNGLTLTTLNIYPKTFGTATASTLNNPMKGAHDSHLFSSAHKQYYGKGDNWLMSTETMGGWFPPTVVNLASRQHTYGSLLGSGVKAMMIYYFHEGWNWNSKEEDDSELHFDAPLDKDMNPTASFALLKHLGTSLKNGMGEKLVTGTFAPSEVLIAHDSQAQYSTSSNANTLEKTSTESAALFGLLREAGYSPDVAFIDAMSLKEALKYKVIFWEHSGFISLKAKKLLQSFLAKGRVVITIGNVELNIKRSENLIVWKESPARGWNSDEYLKLNNPKLALSFIRDTLSKIGVLSDTLIQTEDGSPYLHVWKRPVVGGFLLIAENFQSAKRNFNIRLPTISPTESFKVKSMWDGTLATSEAAPIEIAGEELIKQGLRLTIESDSVSIWFVENK